MTKTLASLDIGTNSTLFLVADVTETGFVSPRYHDVKTNDLGRGLSADGYLSDEIIALNLDLLVNFKNLADKQGAVEIRIAATEALRKAKNADVLISQVKNELGMEIKIISGEEEAQLTYHGIRSGLVDPNAEIIAIDVGGGSSEFIHGKGDEIFFSTSIPVGAIVLSKMHIEHDPPTEREVEKVRTTVREALSTLPELLSSLDCDLVICGGTASSLASADLGLHDYIPEKIAGHQLSLETIGQFIKQFAQCTLQKRRLIPGIGRRRAEIILPGSILIEELLIKLLRKSYFTSERGLRYGLLVNSGKDNNFA